MTGFEMRSKKEDIPKECKLQISTDDIPRLSIGLDRTSDYTDY